MRVISFIICAVLLVCTPLQVSSETPAHSGSAIAQNDARTIVDKYINHDGKDAFMVNDRATIVKPWGWIFFFDTREVVESHGTKPSDLAGNGPIAVDHCGNLTQLSSGGPPHQIIEQFEKSGKLKTCVH